MNTPASRSAKLCIRQVDATPRGVAVLSKFFADRAFGAELWDVDGNRYIDFASGIAVLNVGHRHPRVVAAVQHQLGEFLHTCYQVVPYEGYVALCELLNALTPGSYKKKTVLFSTGAEAIENAVKIARVATKRSGVIAFDGGFHGRTLLAASLTGKVAPYKLGFGPFPAEVFHSPFPDSEQSFRDARDCMGRIFATDIEPARVAAIVVEPVQGEGGFNVILPEAVQWLRRLCDEHGILLIADEVQTGFGRTGRLFAMDHYADSIGVVPDIMTMAKSLAGGLTLSAVTGRAEVMDAPEPGSLGGTYAGNPLAVAAALAVLEVMREEDLPARGALLGVRLKRSLEQLQRTVPALAAVRGLGGMVAAEFRKPGTGGPDARFAKTVQTLALQHGLLLLVCGMHGNVIRFLFPLTVPDSVFDEALSIFDAVVHQAAAATVVT